MMYMAELSDSDQSTEDSPTPVYVPGRRSGHVAVCSGNTMLAWGGYNDLVSHHNVFLDERYLDPAELWVYHPQYNKWTLHITGGQVPPGTSGAYGFLVGRRMYVFGGHTDNGNTNDLYYLDLDKWTWNEVRIQHNHQKPSPRDKMAGWIHNNKLYIFGGFGPPLGPYLNDHGQFDQEADTGGYRGWNNQLLVFDLSTETWKNQECHGPIPSPRAAHAAACIDGKVYLFGGRYLENRMNDLHVLDLDTLRWSGRVSCHGAVPCGRSWHTFTPVSDSLVVLFGGYTTECQPLGDLWVLDVSTMLWKEVVKEENRPRLWHTSCTTADGDILLFGGCSSDILSGAETATHQNSVLIFRVSPPSLLRLCLAAACHYHSQLQNDYSTLPAHLHTILNMMVEERDSKCQPSQHILGCTQDSSARICTIS